MNAQNLDQQPKVLKNTKNKIEVEFDRLPLKERLKAKFLSFFFLKKVVWTVFRLILLIGISYIILHPYISWLTQSFMAPDDFVDATVRLIPKTFSLDMYKTLFVEKEYMKVFADTFFLSLITALIQTFICCFIAYGLAKFKFKGNKVVFLLVILTLIIPHSTLGLSMSRNFREFDIFGIFGFLNGQGFTVFGQTFLTGFDILPDSFIAEGAKGLNLTNTYWPFVLLSVTGLAFKNGLYIFMLRQFFMGVPDELEESAYIDGSGIMHTFFTIILPISIPMMITVFLFSFSWQWTDSFYTTTFLPSATSYDFWTMHNFVKGTSMPEGMVSDGFPAENQYYKAVDHTAVLMAIAPLVVMYLFCQRYLIQGIERSGLTAD